MLLAAALIAQILSEVRAFSSPPSHDIAPAYALPALRPPTQHMEG